MVFAVTALQSLQLVMVYRFPSELLIAQRFTQQSITSGQPHALPTFSIIYRLGYTLPVVTRNVSGILYDQNGNLATSVTIVVTRIEPVESIDGSLSVMAESKNTLKTNATTAAWDVDLYPGLHSFEFHTVHGSLTVSAAIPNGTGALDWAALSPQMPEYTP